MNAGCTKLNEIAGVTATAEKASYAVSRLHCGCTDAARRLHLDCTEAALLGRFGAGLERRFCGGTVAAERRFALAGSEGRTEAVAGPALHRGCRGSVSARSSRAIKAQ
jgi:hypothetical protein